MEDLYELEIDALAIGITKLPQYMGIPIICFYSNCMGWFLGWMFLHDKISNGILGVLLFSLGFCVSHCYMAGETLRDPFGLRINVLNITNFSGHSNYKFWNNTESFLP